MTTNELIAGLLGASLLKLVEMFLRFATERTNQLAGRQDAMVQQESARLDAFIEELRAEVRQLRQENVQLVQSQARYEEEANDLTQRVVYLESRLVEAHRVVEALTDQIVGLGQVPVARLRPLYKEEDQSTTTARGGGLERAARSCATPGPC